MMATVVKAQVLWVSTSHGMSVVLKKCFLMTLSLQPQENVEREPTLKILSAAMQLGQLSLEGLTK